MSRIVGILSERFDRCWDTRRGDRFFRHDRNPVDSINAMIAGARSNATWGNVTTRLGSAQFGWTGWRSPVLHTDQDICVVIDGSFFNGPELATGRNDAERLANLYRRNGFVDSLRRINGDFAAALYDKQSKSLWLGRDRLGVKPLYFASIASEFAFGSRLRALLSLPGVNKTINQHYAGLFAGSHYRTFDNESNATPFSNIHQLPAGHAACIRDGTVRTTRYWTLEDLPDWTDNDEDLAERYRDLLLDAVKLRFAAASSPAFTLSGGMDSSSVLASAVHVTGQKQHAFSTIYEDKTYDESDEIRTMLDATVEHWHTVALGTPNVFDCVERMIAVHDEPVATATWLSHFLLCERARHEGFGGLFGGLGGDELNAGEYEYFFFHFADLKAAGKEELLGSEIDQWIRYHDHPIYRKSSELVTRELTRIVDLAQPGRCLPDRRRIDRYARAVNVDYFDVRAYTPVMDHPFSSYLRNRTYQDLFRETAPCCLRAEDRQATAMGLENFLPFFDYRLVEFMFRVPGRLKIRDGITKRLLREATRGILPNETRTRVKKTGWNAPAHVWFSGKNASPLRDLIYSQSFRERGIYNVGEVERLLAEHDEIVTTGRAAENHMMFFWQLVNLELWLQSLSHTPVPPSATQPIELGDITCLASGNSLAGS